ncbi:hypothetical protein PF008_g31358 [Phytophthora fragariae]|uniref:Secreted protein n=1 Tax=Phytophthora fragariae TaxID=53985 RepID=A0A6G0Q301_9STRA|nr:hypothetical protein PF008_g31358 [Phytophthora fragariae]
MHWRQISALGSVHFAQCATASAVSVRIAAAASCFQHYGGIPHGGVRRGTANAAHKLRARRTTCHGVVGGLCYCVCHHCRGYPIPLR